MNRPPRRSWIPTALALALIAGCTGNAAPPARGPYFGQPSPGLTPRVFAPGVVSLRDRYEYSIVFSPDLTECLFGVTDSTWSSFTLHYARMAGDGSWSAPVEAPFLGSGDALSPAFSPDGRRLAFASMRPAYPPANLWQVERDSLGVWGPPVKLPPPVNTAADEWSPCFANDGTLYFVSYRAGGHGDADIFRAVPSRRGYASVTNLGPPIDSAHLDSTPFIAADGSYLIFESDRPGGFGQQDLWICHRLDDGWSEPVNLGPNINTQQIEDEAYVTPDGKYLFFNRRAAFVTAQPSDLYWVEVGALLDPAPGR